MELVRDAQQRAGARGRKAAPVVVQPRLDGPGEGEVVVARREGARDCVVEAAVQPAVRVCRRHDEVEPGLDKGQRAVVVGDCEGREAVGCEGGVQGGAVGVVDAQHVDVRDGRRVWLGWRHDGGCCALLG